MYENNLEIHFWDWLQYNKKYLLWFNEYQFDTKKIDNCIVTYYPLVDVSDVNENIYEIERQTFKSPKLEDIRKILEKYIVENVEYKFVDNVEYFYVNISNGYVYYSYEFGIWKYINDLFSCVKDKYIDLINIFKPKVSNCWFEVLWEDIYRIEREKYFEWLCWYIKKEYEYIFNFIDIERKIDVWDWYLFRI